MMVFVVLFVVLNYFLDLLFKIPSKPKKLCWMFPGVSNIAGRLAKPQLRVASERPKQTDDAGPGRHSL